MSDTDFSLIIEYWRESADRDYKTMQNLVASNDYHWALFMGHLVLEKILKALYVKRKKEQAVFSHDLLRLTNNIDLSLTNEKEDWLDTITSFNINARYDNYKQHFYKICTKEYTEKWINRIAELRTWLINQL